MKREINKTRLHKPWREALEGFYVNPCVGECRCPLKADMELILKACAEEAFQAGRKDGMEYFKRIVSNLRV